jgi:hypothetical protein
MWTCAFSKHSPAFQSVADCSCNLLSLVDIITLTIRHLMWGRAIWSKFVNIAYSRFTTLTNKMRSDKYISELCWLSDRLVCGRAGLARKHSGLIQAPCAPRRFWLPPFISSEHPCYSSVGALRGAPAYVLDRWSPSVSEGGNFERETSE